jgi:hypothetical protein
MRRHTSIAGLAKIVDSTFEKTWPDSVRLPAGALASPREARYTPVSTQRLGSTVCAGRSATRLPADP